MKIEHPGVFPKVKESSSYLIIKTEILIRKHLIKDVDDETLRFSPTSPFGNDLEKSCDGGFVYVIAGWRETS